ncbi:hypothetical protein ACP70R_010369 [Stipagrostis hirtigluma subsp. patula]
MDATAGEASPPPTSSSPPEPPPELAMVARAVQRLVARNDALATAAGVGTAHKGMAAFEAAPGAPAPRIGVAEYLERVHRYAALEPECYVVAYAYVDRAAHRRPAAAVASRNVHRLLLACLLVASKVLDDFHHSNAFFARVGGVSNAEMNRLELELLDVLDFEVAVGHRAYGRYREHLEHEMRRDGGHGLPRAPPKPATAASCSGKPPRPARPTTERSAAATAGGDERGRRLSNGAPAEPPLRELWVYNY